MVLLVLALLVGFLVPRIDAHVGARRDAQRLKDVLALRQAIERFHRLHGRYPQPQANSRYGGWDVSCDGEFIPELVGSGLLDEVPLDPLDGERFHYRYFVYPPGDYGCRGSRPFFVLGVREFENADFAARNRGFFRCGARDWGDEFAFVTGGGAGLER